MKILRTKASEVGYGEIVEMSEPEIIALLMTADEFCSYIVYQMRRKTPCFSYGDIRRSPSGESFLFTPNVI